MTLSFLLFVTIGLLCLSSVESFMQIHNKSTHRTTLSTDSTSSTKDTPATVVTTMSLNADGHATSTKSTTSTSTKDNVTTAAFECTGHPSTLPGDPSLNLITNVDLGDKKLEIMKACSKAICEATGKPEAYIAVSITDKMDIIFGGSDDPAALGTLTSIGAISMESNGAVTSKITDLLEPFGVAANRMYINFFDMPRANVGWNRKTFAG